VLVKPHKNANAFPCQVI